VQVSNECANGGVKYQSPVPYIGDWVIGKTKQSCLAYRVVGSLHGNEGYMRRIGKLAGVRKASSVCRNNSHATLNWILLSAYL
jgi:hypothetical protein